MSWGPRTGGSTNCTTSEALVARQRDVAGECQPGYAGNNIGHDVNLLTWLVSCLDLLFCVVS